MNLQELKVLLIVVTAVSGLIVVSPAIQRLLSLLQTESFSELWLLDPEHMAENYPFNINRNTEYKIFLGISNHVGQTAYYSVQVKLRNETQSAPNSLIRASSSLAPLYSLNVFVADKETWELPITFSFDYSYDDNQSRVNFNKLTFNQAPFSLNEYSTSWNSNRTVFFGNLFFELWIYNNTIGDFQYHERYVDLKFNMTV